MGFGRQVRPIFHHRPAPGRAHVFLCMLAYYVEWHMRRALAPMLFDDHNPQGAQERRASIVAPAQRSPEAERKAARKRTDDGLPAFDKTTRPTPLQQRALDLLGIRL